MERDGGVTPLTGSWERGREISGRSAVARELATAFLFLRSPYPLFVPVRSLLRPLPLGPDKIVLSACLVSPLFPTFSTSAMQQDSCDDFAVFPGGCHHRTSRPPRRQAPGPPRPLRRSPQPGSS